MNDRRGRDSLPPSTRRTSSSVLIYWYGAMAVAGLGFGLIGERRPFGGDVLAHPLVVFFLAVAIGLLVLRLALARPVPEVIPDRVLVIGCFVGLAAFLAGNFISTRLLGTLPN